MIVMVIYNTEARKIRKYKHSFIFKSIREKKKNLVFMPWVVASYMVCFRMII